MQILSNIVKSAKNIVNEGILYKAAGAATLGCVIYDAHRTGRVKSINLDKIETADRYDKNYKQYMTLHKASPFIAGMKNWWFSIQQTFSFHHVISKATGYIQGLSKTVLSNLPEIGISILALRYRHHPLLSKIAAGLLCLNALKSTLYDIIGIGADKN